MIGGIKKRFVKKIIAEHGGNLPAYGMVFPVAVFPRFLFVFFPRMTTRQHIAYTHTILLVFSKLEGKGESCVVDSGWQQNELFSNSHTKPFEMPR